MALSKAIKFLQTLRSDLDYRTEIYHQSKAEVLAKFGFDEFEFENAINMQLVQCQSYEEAEMVLQIKMCFSML